jgi:hypothetical protein
MTKLFENTVRYIRPRLLKDFPMWTADDANACIGNLAHETAGFTKMQEIKPLVPGSKGGFGWAQWTGPRRRSFEAYCRRNDLDVYSNKANYAFLFIELTTTEKHTIKRVAAARGLDAKTIAFEKAFERAGIKHYNYRINWAKKAAEVEGPTKVRHKAPTPDAPTILDRLIRLILTLFSLRS